MTQEIKLDRYDLALLRALQRNARASLQELSAEVGLSSSPCWARVKRMEEAGLILRRVTILDREKLGLDFEVYCAVKLSLPSKENLAAMERLYPTVEPEDSMPLEVKALLARLALLDMAEEPDSPTPALKRARH